MDKKCAPGKDYSNGSCFSLEQLINISIQLNKKNPNKKIKIVKDKKKLLKSLTHFMKTKYNCTDQLCWLKTDLIKSMNNENINFFTFRPDGPEKKNRMVKYIRYFKCFKTIWSKIQKF